MNHPRRAFPNGKIGWTALVALAFGAAGATAFAEATKGLVNGQYVVTVPQGETYELTAADVAEIGTSDFVKRGAGMLRVPAGLTDIQSYAGRIYIYEGIYNSFCVKGTGSAEAKVYVDGGTFQNSLQQGGAVVYPSEMHFKGTGHKDGTKDLGAFRNLRNISNGFRAIVLDGDALFTVGRYLGDAAAPFAVMSSLDMGGHTLTLRADDDVTPVNAQMTIAAAVGKAISNMGDFVIDRAHLFSGALLGDCTKSLTLLPGAVYDYVRASGATSDGLSHGGVNLVLENDTTLRVQTETALYAASGYNNNWWGAVTVKGRTTVTNLASAAPGSYILFGGKVTGPGGFDVKGGAKLVFYKSSGNDANDFAGDITVEGIPVAAGTTVNGVASGRAGGEICGVLGAVIGLNAGAIPTNVGQKVVLKNGHFIHAQTALPAVESSGTGVVFSTAASAYAVPALTGCPAFTNGTATLTGTWTVRPADVAAAKPLEALSDAAFAFGTGSRVVLSDEAATADGESRLTKGATGLGAVLSQRLESTRFRLKRLAGDLWLALRGGLCIILK